MYKFTLGSAVIAFFLSCNSNKPPEPSAAAPVESWDLVEKNRYSYKLNAVGQPDTIFIANIKYEKGALKDSSVNFVANRWKDNRVVEEKRYVMSKGGVPGLLTTAFYDYNSQGKLVGKKSEAAGKLLTSDKYTYNDKGQLINTTTVQIKSRNLTTGGSLDISKADNNSIGYDTLLTTYQYDSLSKVIGARFTNPRGEVIAQDVNTYAGNDPLLSASLNSKGDTVKRITFEQRGKILMTVTETDSVTLFQNLVNGIQIAQKTKYKNRSEQWRSAVRFNERTGRKEEENLYRLR